MCIIPNYFPKFLRENGVPLQTKSNREVAKCFRDYVSRCLSKLISKICPQQILQLHFAFKAVRNCGIEYGCTLQFSQFTYMAILPSIRSTMTLFWSSLSSISKYLSTSMSNVGDKFLFKPIPDLMWVFINSGLCANLSKVSKQNVLLAFWNRYLREWLYLLDLEPLGW